MIREYDIAAVLRIYQGSDGDATKALYTRLELLGPIGFIAVNLFRATKCSERAKEYRGRQHKQQAYDRKQWSIDNLCACLARDAESVGIVWGWGEDQEQSFHKFVLYVDIPTGQVSFHSATRQTSPDVPSPDYPGAWDGIRGFGPDRVCRWVARLLKRDESAEAA